MLRMAFVTAFAAVALGSIAAPASASVTLTGNYIKVGISNYGTLGSGGATSPGLIHDPTGTGTFDASTDYITPGVPHEGYSINSTQSGFIQADNDAVSTGFGVSSPSLLTGAAAMGYDNAATWSGSNAFVSIVNSYFFNDGDERIEVYTTLTALQDLTNLAFARSVDPDSGGFNSLNQRGNLLFGVEDFIGSASEANGRTLALVNLNGSTLSHNTRIDPACCDNINPYTVLTGSVNNTVGDDSLNLAYLIGNLATGNSITLHYAYAVGTHIEVVGGGSAVPEPATWAMMLLGFALVGGMVRRRPSRTLAFAA